MNLIEETIEYNISMYDFIDNVRKNPNNLNLLIEKFKIMQTHINNIIRNQTEDFINKVLERQNFINETLKDLPQEDILKSMIETVGTSSELQGNEHLSTIDSYLSLKYAFKIQYNINEENLK